MGKTDPLEKAPESIAFVLIPRFNMAALATTIEPLRVANYISPRPLYSWTYLSAEGGPLEASNGMSQETTALADAGGQPALAFVCGSWRTEHYDSPPLFSWLRRMERKGVTLAATDMGAYVLARAGLLSGRAATTHWSCLAGFAEQFPQVQVCEQLFTIDRKIMTCGGGTAGIDLMLHLLAQRHGEQLAAEVADQILHHPIRRPDAAQRQTLGARSISLHPTVRAAIGLMEANLGEPWPVPAIAAEVGVSQRKLERLFRRYMGCSIVQCGQILRLQYARVLLTSTEMSIREVSAACGFNSLSHFSQAFAKIFERRPSDYRQAWPLEETAPRWPGTVFEILERTKGLRP